MKSLSCDSDSEKRCSSHPAGVQQESPGRKPWDERHKNRISPERAKQVGPDPHITPASGLVSAMSCAFTSVGCAALTRLAVALAREGRPVRLWAFEPEVCESILSRRENELFLPGVKLPSGIEATNDLQQGLDGAGVG